VDLPTFRVTFPEFASAPDALVARFLAAAALRTDARFWGNPGAQSAFAVTLAASVLSCAGMLLEQGQPLYFVASAPGPLVPGVLYYASAPVLGSTGSGSFNIQAELAATLYDQGHGYLTAHLLATAPNGQFARLQVVDKKGVPTGRTLYADQRERLESQVTIGARAT
jgi:uncharacterized membrane protein YjjB (DUF3815 family)